jgi:hypothetical protein
MSLLAHPQGLGGGGGWFSMFSQPGIPELSLEASSVVLLLLLAYSVYTRRELLTGGRRKKLLITPPEEAAAAWTPTQFLESPEHGIKVCACVISLDSSQLITRFGSDDEPGHFTQ